VTGENGITAQAPSARRVHLGSVATNLAGTAARRGSVKAMEAPTSINVGGWSKEPVLEYIKSGGTIPLSPLMTVVLRRGGKGS